MRVRYQNLEGKSAGYWWLFATLLALILAGTWAALYMEHEGHRVTGMDNQVVWGMPHVFAVFMIVAASGALNVATLASVFGRAAYAPLGRLSGLLAVALLLGGLLVLVLDLGRPDRLIIAMTYYNFKSIFAWNIFLYLGFLLVVAVYLWMMFEPRMHKYHRPAGLAAFIWRLVLTTGTGCIFGFLVARQGYDAAIMAPMFIAMSLSFGGAVFILVLVAACTWTGRVISGVLLHRLGRLLAIFVAAVLYFALIHHLTNLYAAEHHGIERFILFDGGVYTALFWLGQILLGGAAPLVLLLAPPNRGAPIRYSVLASALVVAGGFVQLYIIIVGGQAYPLILFPGMEVQSSFFDGVVNEYAPSLPEILLGIGGLAVALFVTLCAMRVLPFLPERIEIEVSGKSTS